MTHALRIVVAALVGCLLAVAPARAQGAASPNDMARLLAGLPLPDGSPLAAYAQDRNWQQHSAVMNKTWSDLERKQLGPIKTWSQANLTQRRSTTFYFFSGPDFLYVDSFFPDSDVYVLAGLEPTGGLPDVSKIKSGALAGEYGKLRTSMRSILNLSYFITREMDQDLRTSQLRGTLPILYVFMARAGKTLHEVSFVSLDADGTEKADAGEKGAARGVKIIFSGADGKKRTLYYFRTDLSNSGLVNNGFLAFCSKLGVGDVFIKAASYLLHGAAFSQTREFLLDNGASIVQDDTGIPLRFLEARKWGLHPFGEYVGPIPLFRGHYQRSLQVLFHRLDAPSIDFGVGYRWRPNQSHVLLAVNQGVVKPIPAVVAPQPATPPPAVQPAVIEKPADTRTEAPAAGGEIGKAAGITSDRKVDSIVTKRPSIKTVDSASVPQPAAVVMSPVVAQAPSSTAMTLSWLFLQALMIGSLIWGVIAYFDTRQTGRS
jgi:hypothetical protein